MYKTKEVDIIDVRKRNIKRTQDGKIKKIGLSLNILKENVQVYKTDDLIDYKICNIYTS